MIFRQSTWLVASTLLFLALPARAAAPVSAAGDPPPPPEASPMPPSPAAPAKAKPPVVKAAAKPAAGKAGAAKATAPQAAAKPAALKGGAPKAGAGTSAETSAKPAAGTGKYLLRYKFKPGQTLRWEVAHRAQIRTTVQGSTQTAETTSMSIKSWKVTGVDASGNATFEHLVESVDMRHKLTGRQEVHYDSRTDKQAPHGFEDVAKAVGVTLTVVKVDAAGKILHREDKRAPQSGPAAQMTMPLPETPIAIGESWTVPFEIVATAKDGSTRAIKMRQQLTLDEVNSGIATIDIDAQVLSPVHDPTIEAQLVQSELKGKLRFDIEAGLMLTQKSDCDKHVVGFQGESSNLHYVTRFEEKLLPAGPAATAKVAGPELPPKMATASQPVVKKAPAPTAKRPAARRR